jgi:hypothetical protein
LIAFYFPETVETSDFGIGIFVNFTGPISNLEIQNSNDTKVPITIPVSYNKFIFLQNDNWTKSEKTNETIDALINKAFQFRPGELFILQLISLKSGLKSGFKLSLNCGPYFYLESKFEIPEGSIFNVTVNK